MLAGFLKKVERGYFFLNLKVRCRLLEDLSFDFPKFRALQFAPIFTFFLICEELAEDIGDTIYKISYDLS